MVRGILKEFWEHLWSILVVGLLLASLASIIITVVDNVIPDQVTEESQEKPLFIVGDSAFLQEEVKEEVEEIPMSSDEEAFLLVLDTIIQ